MKTLKQLMQEIIEVTTDIETNYPELYKYIGEMPLTFGETQSKSVELEDLKQYLESLKSQLQHHIEEHKLK